MGSKEKPPDRWRDQETDESRTAWAKGLRARYDRAVREPMPEKFRKLLKQLEDAESRER